MGSVFMNTRIILLALSGILVLGPTSLIMSTEVVPVNNSDVKVEKFEQVKTTDVKPVPKPMDASKVDASKGDSMDRQTTDFQHSQDVHHVSPMDR